MTTIAQRQAAFKTFEARATFIRQLIELMEIACDENGNVVDTNECKLEQFYDAIDEYDADVKAIEEQRLYDLIDAAEEAQQGWQALGDDD